ncbi:MAG: hypothetical protein ACI4EE_10480 [Lachnospiraceae bacterium]
MGWDEVKKAINSDLNVPLNERMTYIDGILPRGLNGNTVSKSGSNYNGELLNITGRGFICIAKALGSVDPNNKVYLSATMDIYIDENTDNSRYIKLYAYSSSSNSSPSASISFDKDNLFQTLSIEPSILLQNDSRIINKPIEFKESLRVNVSIANSFSYTASVTITYAIF